MAVPMFMTCTRLLNFGHGNPDTLPQKRSRSSFCCIYRSFNDDKSFQDSPTQAYSPELYEASVTRIAHFYSLDICRKSSSGQKRCPADILNQLFLKPKRQVAITIYTLMDISEDIPSGYHGFLSMTGPLVG